jgi:hypothetical protein
MYLKEFLLAVGAQWVVLMSGIASVAIALYLRMTHRGDIPNWVFWIIGIVCLGLAAFLAWNGEHVALFVERQKNRPQLVGEINEVMSSGRAVNKDGKPSFGVGGIPIIVTATVSNLGMPSIVRKWTLNIKLPDGQMITPEPNVVPMRITADSPSGQPMEIYGEDALHNKGMTPIPQGGAITGILLYVVRNFPREQIYQDGTLVILGFEDVVGKKSEATLRLGPHRAKNWMYFPGMKSPIPPPPKAPQ